MSWIDRYQEASFRGVKFHVLSAPSEFGRELVVHEFPYRPKPYVEDLRRKTQKFPITGFLVGDDYNFTRDILIKAAEKEGPGKLVHPLLGIKDVRCLSLRVEESFREGSYARVIFEFIEAGEKKGPLGFIDSILDAVNKANDFIDNAALQFAEAFSVIAAPAYVVQSAARNIDRLGDFILSKNGLGAVSATVSDLTSSVEALKRESLQLARSPKQLATKINSSIKALGRSFNSGPDSVNAILAASDQKLETKTVVEFKTKNRRRERDNTIQLEMLFRSQCLGIASLSLLQFIRRDDLESRNISVNDLLDIRASLVSRLDALSGQLSLNLVSYRLIRSLRTALLSAIPGSVELPVTKTVTLDQSMSAFQLSYRLYGSVSQAKDIIRRNSIANPSLIAAGTKIEYTE